MSTTLRPLLACLIVAVAAGLASGQNEATRQPTATQQSETTDSARTTADENFELNITERRITRSNFAASTSVEAGEESARGLNLRIGVEVGASRIDLLLRNVRGQVRFRATLERVLDRINAR
ncbi:MAG TPA: hypothetical protein VGO69_01855, partial [Pyrinomonadaceae bacterium]|nr:hypothetical protein [Pyrinomonadaceae bacterium]